MKVSELQLSSRLYPLQNKPLSPSRIKSNAPGNKERQTFSEILNTKLGNASDIKFSAHAVRRLEERRVDMSDNALSRLSEGVQQLDAKGSVNSVILMDQTAFVVSVKNRTVVTAVDNGNAGSNIFTNIDSVAIV